MSYRDRIEDTIIYVDWFAICDLTFKQFTEALMSVVWDRFPEFTRFLPEVLEHDLPNDINDYMSTSHQEVIKYMHDDLFKDMDFLNSIMRSNLLHCRVNDTLINKIMNLPKIGNVYILSEISGSAMNFLSSEWRMWYVCDKMDTEGRALQHFLSSLSPEHDIAFVTRDYVLSREDGVIHQYSLNDYFGQALQ